MTVSSTNSAASTTTTNTNQVTNSPLQPNILPENFTLVSNNPEQFTVPPKYTISSSKLESIKEACTSPRNFCVQFLRILFSKKELVDNNLTGTKGNRMLDS